MRDTVLEYFQSQLGSLKGTKIINRAMVAIYLFDFLDRLLQEKFPANWFDRMKTEVDKVHDMASLLETNFDIPGDGKSWQEDELIQAIDLRTGNVYFKLWQNFTKQEYYQQPKQLLEDRFIRNNLDISKFSNGIDAGCGGGRYTLALKSLGIEKMQGVDISPDSVAFAQNMSDFQESEVNFQQASVLELPFDNESFDFVFSNGVLHHTVDTQQGVNELYRVLQTRGEGWLYLYGGKNSLFWDIVDFCREILSDIPQSYTQMLMKVMGYPPGRIFHRADFWYVPINNRYFEQEVDEMLNKAGFCSFKRLHRGTGHDWDEIIHDNPSMDSYIYGEGEMRYWLVKD